MWNIVSIGQLWTNLHTGRNYVITEITGTKIWLDNGEYVQTNSLLKNFKKN